MSAPPPPAALTLVPETAPFSPEQRAWLNGFLAGWLGIAPGEAPSMNGIAAPAAPVPAAEPEEDFPWHDPALPIAERLALAEDRPKPRLLMAAMAQLDCGACGYQCRTYAEAIASGAETSLTLCSPGGRETSKALKQLLNGNGAANGSATNGHANGHAANGAAVAPPQPLGTRGNPARARVLETRRLNGPESEKHTTHAVLDLPDSNPT